VKKRFRFFNLSGLSVNSNTPVLVQLFLDTKITLVIKSFTLLLSAASATWNGSQWDQSQWGGATGVFSNRKRIAKTGLSWRVRLSNRTPDQDVEIHMVGMSTELLSEYLN